MAYSLHRRVYWPASDPPSCLRHPPLRLPFSTKSSLAAADAVMHPDLSTLPEA